jgi:hypothetical protein
MAEVLSPALQSPTNHSMMHSRPSSADAFQNGSLGPSQPNRQHAQRGIFNNQNAASSYRGISTPPVAPYAFQQTPNLRTSSAPNMHGQTALPPPGLRPGHAATSSTSSQSSSSSSSNPSVSQDDSAISVNTKKLGDVNPRVAPTVNLSTAVPDLTLSIDTASPKSTPDRYRRAHQRANTTVPNSQPKGSAPPSGSGMAGVGHLWSGDNANSPARPRSGSLGSGMSVDDTVVPRQGATELAKRYRRRSVANVDVSSWGNVTTPASDNQPPSGLRQPPSRDTTQAADRPKSFHERPASKENVPRENVPPVRTDMRPPVSSTASQSDPFFLSPSNFESLVST